MENPTKKSTKVAKNPASTPIANASLSYFNIKKYESVKFTELGTIKSIFPSDVKIEPYLPNFNNPDENVFFVITFKDGTSTSVGCSRAVSELLRSEELTISQACNLPVRTSVIKEGKRAGQMGSPKIQMPADEANRIGNNGKELGDLKDEKFDPSAVNRSFQAPAW
jgi:hypothetical protein